jgi:DNA-binding transcriptional MerR regulator
MMEQHYTETVSKLAREAEVLPETIRLYGDLGLIEFIRLDNGMRLHKPSAVNRVREIYAERMARRGRRHGIGSAA